MKYLFATVILWSGLFMTTAQSQEFNARLDVYTQNLNIYNQNKIVAVLSGQNIHLIKENMQWRNLLSAFKGNIESIKDQIPVYQIYKIEYQKNYNLIVEEVEGTVRYQVENGQTSFDTNQSQAILNDKDFSIQLNFGTLEGLINNDYEAMIESALSNLGKKPGRYKRIYFPRYNYDYSFSRKEMMKQKKKIERRLVIPINGTVGLFRGSPIYEFGVGLGVQLKNLQEDKSNLLYVFASTAYQYNKEIDKMEVDLLGGLAWKTKRAGTISLAFPFENKSIYRDIDFRIGTTLHSRNLLAVSIYWNVNLDAPGDDLGFIPSLAFGFSF